MWVKRDECETIVDVIERNCGCDTARITQPTYTRPEAIPGLREASNMISDAIKERKKIMIVGDYDADGICASAELYLLIKGLSGGREPGVRIPKRMSEGYGLSERIVDEIKGKCGLLITVDNGIGSAKAIKKAKEYGKQVIILDHHLAEDEIPPADIIVDVEAFKPKDEAVFRDFCGAGLVFKLAEIMLAGKETILLEKIKSLAAIATVADSVTLMDDNRRIVMEGIDNINKRFATKGLQALVAQTGNGRVSVDTIKYQIAPVLSASGRMDDDGGQFTCTCITKDKRFPIDEIHKLVVRNEERKHMTSEIFMKCKDAIRKDVAIVPPIVVADAQIPTGLAGIIASKLTKEYKCPTIVFSMSEDGVWKGSARSYDGVDLKGLLDEVKGNTVSHGGHAGAAGVTVLPEKLAEFTADIKKQAERHVKDGTIRAQESQNDMYYDLEIHGKDVNRIAIEIESFGPLPRSASEPLFLIKNLQLEKFQKKGRRGKRIRAVGETGEHALLKSEYGTITAFGLQKELLSMKLPNNRVDIIAALVVQKDRKWGGNGVQLQAVAIRPSVI